MFITDEIELSRLSYPVYTETALSNALFFDIETSGVSFTRSHITVIGAACLSGGNMRFFQWFADTPGSEGGILQDFLKFAESFDTLVTYNGTGFDLPYIKRRIRLYFPGCTVFENMDHIDLFKYSKPFADLFRLPDRKLKTIEEGLFLSRDDRVSGADCIALYRGFLSTGDAAMRDLILLHNREDVLDLADVMHIIPYVQIRDGAFEATGWSAGQDTLEINCILEHPVPRPVDMDDPQYNVKIRDDSMTVLFKGSFCEKKLFRKDYRNYYYLKNEDCAVHKSVGQFIAKDSREPAKASTCYERCRDIFFAQPEPVITPDFRDDYRDKTSCFRLKEASGPDAETLHDLCQSVISKRVFGRK